METRPLKGRNQSHDGRKSTGKIRNNNVATAGGNVQGYYSTIRVHRVVRFKAPHTQTLPIEQTRFFRRSCIQPFTQTLLGCCLSNEKRTSC